MSPQEWIDGVRAALRLLSVRSARMVSPDRHIVVFLTTDAEGRRHALVWADEIWSRDDPGAVAILRDLLAVLASAGYASAWATTSRRTVLRRAKTERWPTRWYPQDEANIHDRDRYPPRPPGQPSGEGT